ncbi:30S ribosomal protein S1 [Fibrisoma limi BUZ 3]|uniref:30S ribosomal protein S1 n=1 Tax=Fibrisoma limi BUZ 3 TaxID=1185876 RepID=I2GR27_9BACT|nr:30S ribosomal protein S1 [Fibrisoma limi BUZ 3]
MVLELDVENRRLALGHKQLEENPWDTFETVFAVGTIHRCTILSKTDKMATLELPYGIEGFSSLKNLAKEDGTLAEVGETLDFKVTEFSKEEKRIMLSHTKTWQEKNEPAKEQKPKAGSSAKPAQSQPERGATLGDLDALAALKEQMEGRN